MLFLFYVISVLNDLKIYTTFQIYAIIFSLTLFGLGDPWLHFCRRLAQSDITVMPSVRCMA